MRTLISTGRSSNRVFLFATSEVSLRKIIEEEDWQAYVVRAC